MVKNVVSLKTFSHLSFVNLNCDVIAAEVIPSLNCGVSAAEVISN
jgi:hypothetical protein